MTSEMQKASDHILDNTGDKKIAELEKKIMRAIIRCELVRDIHQDISEGLYIEPKNMVKVVQDIIKDLE